MKITGLLMVILIGLAGHASVETVFDIPTDLHAFKRIYVQSSQNDSNRLDEMLVNELQAARL